MILSLLALILLCEVEIMTELEGEEVLVTEDGGVVQLVKNEVIRDKTDDGKVESLHGDNDSGPSAREEQVQDMLENINPSGHWESVPRHSKKKNALERDEKDFQDVASTGGTVRGLCEMIDPALVRDGARVCIKYRLKTDVHKKSVFSGDSFSFVLGKNEVIRGVEIAVRHLLMKGISDAVVRDSLPYKGAFRISAEYGYGDSVAIEGVEPNSDLFCLLL